MNAEDVRMLMPCNQLEKWIRETDKNIKNAAARDQWEVRVAYDIYKGWKHDNGGVPMTTSGPGKAFADHYRSKGFKVDEYYNAAQFVDTGIKISWKKDDE